MIKKLWRRFRRTDELEDLRKAYKLASTPNLLKAGIEGGRFSATFEHAGISMLMAEEFYRTMETSGAENVLECRIRSRSPVPGRPDIMVTYQKIPGKTPMDLTQEARAERDVLVEKLEESHRLCRELMQYQSDLQDKVHALNEQRDNEHATTTLAFSKFMPDIMEVCKSNNLTLGWLDCCLVRDEVLKIVEVMNIDNPYKIGP